MTELEIKRLEASIFVFNGPQNGITPFYLVDRVVAHSDKISLGVAVSVFYDEKSDEKLYLRLVKCEGIKGRFRGTELKCFCLSDNCDGNGTKCSTFEIKPEDKLGSTTRYRNFYTFSIKNIPTIGSGLYAVTLVRRRKNYYSVLASYYFHVVDDRDSER